MATMSKNGKLSKKRGVKDAKSLLLLNNRLFLNGEQNTKSCREKQDNHCE